MPADLAWKEYRQGKTAFGCGHGLPSDGCAGHRCTDRLLWCDLYSFPPHRIAACLLSHRRDRRVIRGFDVDRITVRRFLFFCLYETWDEGKALLWLLSDHIRSSERTLLRRKSDYFLSVFRDTNSHFHAPGAAQRQPGSHYGRTEIPVLFPVWGLYGIVRHLFYLEKQQYAGLHGRRRAAHDNRWKHQRTE